MCNDNVWDKGGNLGISSWFPIFHYIEMYHDLLEAYWLDSFKRDIVELMAKCTNCQQVKVEHQRPGCLTHVMDVPTFLWEDINIDLIVGLPRQNNSRWVIVDNLTKSAQFILVKSNYLTEE